MQTVLVLSVFEYQESDVANEEISHAATENRPYGNHTNRRTNIDTYNNRENITVHKRHLTRLLQPRTLMFHV